jgi:uncharacterized protein YukE
MKDKELRELTARIRQELEEIERVLARMKEGWERARRSNDDYYLDGVALNLHGFYSGVERIFTQIAETIDGHVPGGENWHQVLLQQMMDEVSRVRPAVISTETGKRLNEHRGFRHIVRNVYTYKLDAAKMGKLVLSAQDLFDQFKAEITAFVAFLERE